MYLNDIKTLLTTESNVYINSLPDTPDNAILLKPYGISKPDLTFDGELIRYPYVQIIVRDISCASALSRAENILETLNSEVNIIPVSDIYDLGQDEKKRTELSINFQITIL